MKTTKEAIIQTAVALFKEHGADNVSVDMICKECGITKGSFYHHFSAKDDILLNYWDYVSIPVKDILSIADSGESPKEKLRAIMNIGISAAINEMGQTGMSGFWKTDLEHGNRVLSPFAFVEGDVFSEQVTGYLLDLVRQAQEAGEVHSDKEPKELLLAYYSSVMGLSVNWATSGADYDVGGYLNTFFDIIFD